MDLANGRRLYVCSIEGWSIGGSGDRVLGCGSGGRTCYLHQQLKNHSNDRESEWEPESSFFFTDYDSNCQIKY